jgi:UDP-GlcNAc:undecaprenyl-phosphate GlcNAc-1-phosphate transferase
MHPMQYMLAFLLALSLTILFSPISLWVARKFNFIDPALPTHPGNLQTKPLPRAGGLAMYAAFVLSVLLLVHPLTVPIIAILAAAGLNVAVGTLDDRRSIHPFVRLGALALSALIVIAAGITIPYVTNPFAAVTDKNWLIYLNDITWTLHLDVWSWAIRPLADGLALLWIVWLINTLNWSKGIGGQLSGITAIAALTLGGTALMFTAGNPAQFTTALLCFIVAGCALGFLPFNFPPERQLPGYGASSFLGLMLAVLSMLSGAKLAAAVLVLGIPTIDGIITIIRRLAQGKSPIWGDSNHLYHKLLNLGLSKRQIVIGYWAVTALLGSLALSLHGKQKIYAFAIVGFGIIAFFLTVSYLIARRKSRA